MQGKRGSSPFVLRYVYGMLAIVAVATATIIVSLYRDQHDDVSTHELVQSFHLESYLELAQLRNDSATLLGLIENADSDDGFDYLRAAGGRGLPISSAGLLESIRTRLLRLASLQEQYDNDLTAGTSRRLRNRFERVEDAFPGGQVTDNARPAVEAFSTTIDQFSRLHTIAADMELRALALRHDQRPRFLVVLILCLGVAVLSVGYLITSLQGALVRQKEAELALAETQERLHNVQKLDALARLVGGVAHDFNNLLTTVLGHAELLRRSPKCDDNLRSGLDEIRTAGARAATLTRQLLAFSRRQHADRSVLDLNQILNDMQSILRRTVGDDIEVTCELADEPFAVEIDPGQFHQLMMNLASNARDAMPEGGALKIVTENASIADDTDGVPDGDYLKITVSDSGTGMDRKTRQRAFEPFFTTKESDRGTGLGLSTVHGIVADSRGYIALDSEEGQGTEFRLYFPRSEGRLRPVADSEPLAPVQKGSETILIVDDDEQVLRYVSKGLSSLGYRVLSAADGATGLQICRQEPGDIDVILTDVVMSGMNGPQFLSKARRLRPQAAGIYMSAYTKDIILWRANEGDDIPLVTKPFELETLSRVIRQSLENFDVARTQDA